MHDPGDEHAVVTGEPAAPKGCTAGSGRRPLEKDPHSGNLASGLPVLLHGVPPGRQFMLFLRYDGRELRVAVHDSGPGVPLVAERADEGAHEGGRGLLLVAALSDKWGVGERELGKVVWCEWDLPIDEVVGAVVSPSPSRSR
ncbi:ATP-binding protein [Streptomyces sp. GQFP]|uniref:ATP-binding protein n=1 Tax=Streptomyces sp. GQFP TaxID=2907545 RepID=UPI001F46AD3B|nr:ATP-binding protein [Streptomyces sp. GQFP]UIX31803.1 ATP-binding protein [Streptomyces sp. GQFP]